MLESLLEKRSVDNLVEMVDSGQTLLASQLLEDARRLVEEARSLAVQSIVFIGTKCPEYYISMIAGMIGNINFLPVDNETSSTRFASLLERSGQSIIISNTLKELDESFFVSLSIKKMHGYWITHSEEFPSLQRGVLISTSGSTGDPKLILVPYSAVSEFVEASLDVLNIEPGSRIAQVSQISFDLSLADFLHAVATNSILVASSSEFSMQRPGRFISENRITNWLSVPSIIPLILEDSTANIDCLRKVIFCGEQLYWDQAARLSKACQNAEIFNAYGPTEGTIYCSIYALKPSFIKAPPKGPVPIGDPLRSYNFSTRRCKDCEELVIKSRYIAAGYVETQQIQPLCLADDKSDLPTLRTGDCVRTHGGELFFEHRMDRQIKIKGYRVEVGDVEENLRRLGLNQPIVGFDGVSLTLYVLPSDAKLASGALEEARSVLPHYMVPRRYKVVSEFSRLISGKIDRGIVV